MNSPKTSITAETSAEVGLEQVGLDVSAVESPVFGKPARMGDGRRREVHANDLGSARLVKTLRENGAYLPQPELSREMMRRTPSEQTGE